MTLKDIDQNFLDSKVVTDTRFNNLRFKSRLLLLFMLTKVEKELYFYKGRKELYI